MLARYARRLLFIEFATYALIAGALLRPGLGWWVFAAVILGLALLMRCLAVMSTFMLAAALSPAAGRTPPVTAGRLSIFSRLGLVAAEIAWSMLAYSVLMPFPRLSRRADSHLPANPGDVPVLFVHGYVCNGAFWALMRRFLEARGVPTYTHDLEPVYAGIDDYAGGLAERIEDICRTTGAPRLIIVGHSMGGLAARACLRASGCARVAKLITLGTPHHGTRTAAMVLGTNARQMAPGCAWLAKLALEERSLPTVPVVSIYSSDDNVIVPQHSSMLGGAKNVCISGVGHVSLAFSRKVRQIVLEEIRGAGGHGMHRYEPGRGAQGAQTERGAEAPLVEPGRSPMPRPPSPWQ